MRTPSVKTLRQAFGTSANEAKRALKMTRQELASTAPGANRLAECYNPPKTWDIRMCVLNDIGGFHGIESIESTNSEYASYLNSGDTYQPTLIYWRGTYRVQSVGDFVETMERQGVKFI
jgi:hypothetical protein